MEKKKNNKAKKTFAVLAIIIAVTLVCCAYAGKLDPQSFLPAPFLSLGFMPMLIVAVLALVVALLWRCWKAALMLVVALALSWPVAKLFVPLNKSADMSSLKDSTATTFTIMTYNVLGFNYHDNALCNEPSASVRLMLDTDPDVVVMQEAYVRGMDWDELPSIRPYLNEVKARYPYRHTDSDGLYILSKYPFTTQPLGPTMFSRSPLGYNLDQDARLARAFDLILPGGQQLRVVDFRLQSYHLSFGKNDNVRISPHVKPSSLERMRRSFGLRGSHANALRKSLDESPRNVIVCGDMNDVTASHVYRVICGDDLRDAWGDAGHGYGYSYNRHGLKFRIDQILYRGDVKPLKTQRLEGGSSDHFPLVATFALK